MTKIFFCKECHTIIDMHLKDCPKLKILSLGRKIGKTLSIFNKLTK
jgi:hypothetical protein